MKAMILAAGKGERMRPLTEHIPKPLLKVRGKTLIEYVIDRLCLAGIHEVVINISYLGHMIENYLGDGSRYDLKIQYSREVEPLETGGGIAKALPLLCDAGENPFLLVNSDVWCEMDLQPLKQTLQADKLAHLVLVSNPEHHMQGDYSLQEGRVNILDVNSQSYTYSGIAVIDPQLFRRYQPMGDKFPLRDLLLRGIQNKQISGEWYAGLWTDVGTAERLASL